MQAYKKGYHNFRFSNDTFNPFHRISLQKNTNFLHKKIIFHKNFSKIANQQLVPHQSPPTTSQEPPTNSQTNNPQSSTRISFQDHPYTFEERTTIRKPQYANHNSLSEPQYEKVCNIYPLSNKTLIGQDTKVKTQTRSK